MTPDPQSPQVPPLPDRFEAVEPLADTPFEQSLRAYDRVLERDVMLKLPGVDAWDGWSTKARERLLREARMLAKVRHEGVEPIHWVDETDAGPLLVMDLPEGELLSERLRASTLSVDEARDVGIQLAEALAAVHYHGIVHRAVGPATVRMLPDGRLRLGTFTFAKGFEVRPMMSSIDHKRRLEKIVAEHLPSYVAPEQLAGRGADPRVDVFALGCLLYRCLTGEDPFAHDQEGTTLPDLRARRPDASKALCEVLRRCTLAAPTARYPTAQAVAEALRATAPSSADVGLGRRSIVLAGVAALLVGAIFVWQPWSRGSDLPSRPGPPPNPTRLDNPTYKPTYDKCHALLIGIAGAYAETDFARLATPIREIREVRDRLLELDPAWRRPGAITLLEEQDASSTGILGELDRLAREAQPEDAVMIYFAGHGQRDGRQFHLVGANAEGRDPNRGLGFLARERLKNFFDDCPAKHVLAVLDCCSAAAMFDQTRSRGRTIGEPVSTQGSPLLRHRSRQILAATGRKSEASDASASASLPLFCQAFLQALDPQASPFRAKSGVDVRALKGHLMVEMDNAQTNVGAGQKPYLESSSEQGSFVFFFDNKK